MSRIDMVCSIIEHEGNALQVSTRRRRRRHRRRCVCVLINKIFKVSLLA